MATDYIERLPDDDPRTDCEWCATPNDHDDSGYTQYSSVYTVRRTESEHDMTDIIDTDATDTGAQVGETTQSVADAIKLDVSRTVTDSTINDLSATIAQASAEDQALLMAALSAMKASGKRY